MYHKHLVCFSIEMIIICRFVYKSTVSTTHCRASASQFVAKALFSPEIEINQFMAWN
jgi:hypothetical protein